MALRRRQKRLGTRQYAGSGQDRRKLKAMATLSIGPSRRQLLLGAVSIVGSATLLAACGGTGPTTPATTSSAGSAAGVAASPSTAAASVSTTAQPATSVTSSSAAATTAAATTAAASSAPAAAAQAVVYMNWATDDLGMKRENEQLALFAQQNPALKVTMTAVSSSGYQDKLLAGLAGGTGPDVFRDNPADALPLISKGQLASFDPMLATSTNGWWGSKDVKPGVMNWGRAYGKQYGFPIGTGAYYDFSVNRDIWRTTGLADPPVQYNDPSWTFDYVLDAAKKITKGGPPPQQFGINTGMSWSFLHPVVQSWGGDFMDPKTGEFLWTSSSAADGIQWMADLQLKQHVAPSGTENTGGVFNFEKGRLGLTWSTFNLAMYLLSTVGDQFQWDMLPPPHQAGKKPVIWFYVSWAVLNKSSKVPENAWAFLYWYGGPQGQGVPVEYAWTAPLFSSLDSRFASRLGASGAKKNLAIASDFLQYSSPERPELNPRFSESMKILNPALAKVASGQSTANNAMQEIKTPMDQLLKQGMQEAAAAGS